MATIPTKFQTFYTNYQQVTPPTPPKPTFKEALAFWAKLGLISFGGPAGQIAMLHEYVVAQKKWVSDSRFLHALNYCMLLPGPEAQQLATYIGWLLHGRVGGLVAGILFVLPSMLLLWFLSLVYVAYGQLPWVSALFEGLQPAVIAIVVLSLVKIAKKSLLGPLHYFVAALAFVCIFFFNIPFPLILLGVIALAALVQFAFPALLNPPSNKVAPLADDEDTYYINRNSKSLDSGIHIVGLVRQVGVTFVLWAIPLALLYACTSDFAFWSRLSFFFTKAALVTFGGAYAVLPYVAQVSVQQFHWLTEAQMIDGLALGETTPGPLIIVLSFVGFMAGYNHFGGSLAMGSLGLFTTTFYTFLPSFLFVLAGAPIIERTQENKSIRQILGIVTAAVVGVVLNLTIYLGKVVVFPQGISWSGLDLRATLWSVVSLVALYRFKINMIAWIGISALFGLLCWATGF